MSKHKTIALSGQATAEDVLQVARTTLIAEGYLWVPQRPNAAEAHEGGREIRHTAFTFKLRLGLEVRDGHLVLSNVSNGVGRDVPAA